MLSSWIHGNLHQTASHCGRAEGRRMGRLLNVYILLLARVWWANNTVGVQPKGAFLVLPPLCEWYCHEKSHMQMKEAVIRGGKVTSLWERFAEEFGKISALNKGWDDKDLRVQMQIIVLETVDLGTSWVSSDADLILFFLTWSHVV